MSSLTRKLIVVTCLILLHLAVIVLTKLFLGTSQPTGFMWLVLGLPLVDVSLLGVYLASGRADSRLRLLIFAIGIVVVPLGVLATGVQVVDNEFVIGMMFLALLSWLVTIVLRISRVFRKATSERYRFSIAEILTTTFLIAAMLAIVRYSIDVGWVSWQEVYDTLLNGSGGVLCVASAICILTAQLPLISKKPIIRLALAIVGALVVGAVSWVDGYIIVLIHGPATFPIYPAILSTHTAQLAFSWIMLGSIHWAFLRDDSDDSADAQGTPELPEEPDADPIVN